MNIGGLFRGMMGDVQASEPKSLELKTGQVVRGVVLQVLPEQEALMNIGGVQVRAKLETPLKQGQSTMLQVQPESANGQVNLKPLESSGGVQIADSSLPDVIKSLAISDTPANRQLVQALHQAGIALTKENVQAFVQLAGQMPASIPLEDWLPAGIVAMQKGVPLTPEAVLSVKQAIQGQPIHETLTRLEDAIERELGGGKLMTPDSRALLEGVKALVQQVRAASAQLLAQAEVETPLGTNAGAGAQAGAAASAGASGSAGAGAQAGVAATAAGASGSAGAGAQSGAAATAAGASGSAGAGAQASGAAMAAGASGSAGAGAQASGAATAAGASGSAGAGAGAQPLSTTQQQQPEAAEPGQWLGRMMKALGVDHEHQSLKLLHMQGNASATESKAADTLKGLLLQLGQSSDITPALKEAAQQALQQITGQQLLLNTDRSSMFSHVTMFVPLINGNGEQTVAIHIQSRKGSRGGLDADNCRLVFDLKMKSLGDTMVDVQVVNKIVSLQVHNDQPFLADLLEANREEIANGLSAIGYQFISMKCTPYPERLSELNENSTAAIKPGSAAVQLQAVYGQKPYKGVDIRL